MPTNATQADEALVSLAAALCDDMASREIAEQETAPLFAESEEEVRDYWIAIARAAIAALPKAEGLQWRPIAELHDLYQQPIWIASPKLIHGDSNPLGIAEAYWQDTAGPEEGEWRTTSFDMCNDEWDTISLAKEDVTHFAVPNGPWSPQELDGASEPVAWVSPGQLAQIVDRPGDGGGGYLPVRKSRRGNFTMPLYASPEPTPPADLIAEEVDSGMSADAVERAEMVWANLPTGRKWTSLTTHEKALVCHTLARLNSLSPQTKEGGEA